MTEDRVIIGMDPHKSSNTIAVLTRDETMLTRRRFQNSDDGSIEMLDAVAGYRDRVWAVEGANGAGHSVAHRKIDDYNRRIVAEIKSCGTTLIRRYGVGPINAALILGEVGDVSRFPNRDQFASYTGTSPISASSGDRAGQPRTRSSSPTDRRTRPERTADRNASNPLGLDREEPTYALGTAHMSPRHRRLSGIRQPDA